MLTSQLDALWVMKASEASDRDLVVLLVLTAYPDEQDKGFRTQQCRRGVTTAFEESLGAKNTSQQI